MTDIRFARFIAACLAAAVMIVCSGMQSSAEEQKRLSDGGAYHLFLERYAEAHQPSLSYLSKEWPEAEQWRIAGRAKMQELLSYDVESVPLDPKALKTIKRDGFTQYLVSYTIAPDRKTEAFLLIPDGLKGPAPAVVALHDHGAFYYYGKEKIVTTDNQPDVLKNFIETSYGGRTYADELARRGFVVLCPDAFYFGSQRIDPKTVSERFTEKHPDMFSDDANTSIKAFNTFASQHEALTARMLFTAGTTWPGVLFQGDRISVDYLLTRPEVDPERIGCVGLSIGGFRSAHLFGLDPRMKAAVVTGWMTTYSSLIFENLRNHTWMIYVPRQHNYLDLPDVASLNAPNALMVIDCLQDQLFPLYGMQDAEKKLAAVYNKMGHPERFKCNYYDVPHCFNVTMQDDAIDFLEKWLKK